MRISMIWCSILVVISASLQIHAQQIESNVQADDVVRIDTELVQTPVMVFDKKGQFVDKLSKDQFRLTVDGKRITPSFFEQVVDGNVLREGGVEPANTPIKSYDARAIIFFIDDLHLSSQGLEQVRKTILDFIQNEMTASDEVAIASSSGNVGFLQQFTGVKAVLLAAMNRVKYQPSLLPDADKTPMSEFIAQRILQGDRDAITFYTNEMLRSMQFTYALPKYGGKGAGFMVGSEPAQAERMVLERARSIALHSTARSTATLKTLENFLRSSGSIRQRKYMFFLSDGFYFSSDASAERRTLELADAAARSNTQIYAVSPEAFIRYTTAKTDAAGRPDKFSAGEFEESQSVLTNLARVSGGRTIPGARTMTEAVGVVLKEELSYYLLAWEPDAEDQQGGNFNRISVSIADRPELTVRVAHGFLSSGRQQVVRSRNAKPAATAGDDQLTSHLLKTQLDPKLNLAFIDNPQAGLTLRISIQISANSSGYGSHGSAPEVVDLAGVVLTDQGKADESFRKQLTIDRRPDLSANERDQAIIYNQTVPAKPGIYQVRVAVRDSKTGRVENARQWIEVPDLTLKRLTLSTLFLGVNTVNSKGRAVDDNQQVQHSVERRFARDSRMNFLTVIYNAIRHGSSNPVLESEITVLRGHKAVISSSLRKIAVDANTDLARIPYGEDIALRNLGVGRYILRVKITDRIANSVAVQEVPFDVY